MKCKRCKIEYSKNEVRIDVYTNSWLVIKKYTYPCGHTQKISEKIDDGEPLDIDKDIIG